MDVSSVFFSATADVVVTIGNVHGGSWHGVVANLCRLVCYRVRRLADRYEISDAQHGQSARLTDDQLSMVILQHFDEFSACIHAIFPKDLFDSNELPARLQKEKEKAQRLCDAGNPPSRDDVDKPPGQTGKSARRKATVKERMAGIILENSAAMGWNSSRWARELKCAKSTVVETSTWRAFEKARKQGTAERAKDRRRKPKASDLRRGERD
jgi:hypothetical protein